MKKVPFVTLDKLQEITAQFPTPFHLYDEKGIRENAKAVKEAFAWNKGFKEFFAVKATPNPFLIQILQEYGCGCDCSSMTELMMSKAIGCKEGDIMFSSNDTPEEEFKYANEIGGIINLDDITHIESVERAVGYIPKVISCRYNPGGVFKISNDIMDNPGDAKKEYVIHMSNILKGNCDIIKGRKLYVAFKKAINGGKKIVIKFDTDQPISMSTRVMNPSFGEIMDEYGKDIFQGNLKLVDVPKGVKDLIVNYIEKYRKL